MRRRRRNHLKAGAAGLGTIANMLVLLIFPALILGPASIFTQINIVAFVCVAGLACLAEGSVQTWPQSQYYGTPPNQGGSEGPASSLYGIGLSWLLTWQVALVDCALRGESPIGVTWATGAVGVVVMAAGVTLRVASIRTLGRYFLNEVRLLPGQQLVSKRVYAIVRHPSELGTLCLVFGGCITLGSGFGAAAGLWVLALVVRRIRAEDAMLAAVYGVEFQRYQARVRGLLPFPRPNHPASAPKPKRWLIGAKPPRGRAERLVIGAEAQPAASGYLGSDVECGGS